jgi:hypothetical protein
MYAWMSEQAPLRVNARPVLTEWQQNYWDSYTAYARGTGVWTPQERAVERPDEIVRIALNDCALVLLKRSGEVWRSHVPIYRNSPPDVFVSTSSAKSPFTPPPPLTPTGYEPLAPRQL